MGADPTSVAKHIRSLALKVTESSLVIILGVQEITLALA